MREELYLILSTSLTAERVAILMDLYDTIISVGLLNVDEEILDIIASYNKEPDNAAYIDTLSALIVIVAKDLCDSFGTSFNEEVPINVIRGVLLTLTGFEFYIIPEDILDICWQDIDNEQKLSKIVTYFSDVTEMECLDYVAGVEANTIGRIQQVCEDHFHDDEVVIDETKSAKIRIINNFLTANDDNMGELTLMLARNGFAMGAPLDMVISEVYEPLSNMPLNKMAKEILVLVLYSRHDFETLGAGCMEVLTYMIDDLKDQTLARKVMLQVVDQYMSLREEIHFPEVGSV